MNLIFTESCDNTVSNSRFGIGNSAFVTLSERDCVIYLLTLYVKYMCVERQNFRWLYRKERKKIQGGIAFKG